MKFITGINSSKAEQILKLLILAAILLLFHERWELLFSEYVVGSLLCYCKTNSFNDFLLIFLIVGCFLFYRRRINLNYQISFTTSLAILVIVTLYSFYRFFDFQSLWILIPTKFSKHIYYSDLVYVIGAFQIDVTLKNQYDKKLRTPDNQNALAFVLDEELKTKSLDELGRKEFAISLINKISATSCDSAVAFAITGHWGSGKTTFINFMKENCDGDTTILIDFKPWSYMDKVSYVKSFFKSLSEAVSPYSSQLPGFLKEYVSEVFSKGDNFIMQAIHSFNQILTNDNLQEQIQEINNIIVRINKQIIIFIDDLDRVSKEEISDIIRLLRNTANFKNIKFIVAFDKPYILAAVKEINEYEFQNYLDKIFLFIYELPPHQASFTSELKSKLLTKFPEKSEEIEESFSKNNLARNYKFENYLFRSKRDVIRYINAFSFEYPFISNNVVFDDYFRFQFLKFKFPNVLRIIYKNYGLFFENENTTSAISLNPKYKLRKNAPPGTMETLNQLVIEKFLIDNRVGLHLSVEDTENIISQFKTLFDEHGSKMYITKNEHLSIVYQSQFDSYFLNAIEQNHLDENEFRKNMNKDVDHLKGSIKTWVEQNKWYNVIQKFGEIRNRDIESREEFEKIIGSIFFLGDTLAKWNGEAFLFPSLLNKLLNEKLYNGNGEISNKYYNGDVNRLIEFIMEIFDSATSTFDFESYYVDQLIGSGYEVILPIETLYKINENYLKKNLEILSQFNNDIWSYWHYCKHIEKKPHGSGAYTIARTVNPIANKLLLDFIKYKDLDGFLLAVRERCQNNSVYDSETFKISNVVNEIFGSLDNFKLFLDEQDESRWRELTNFKIFYDRLKSDNFKSCLTYT